MSLAFAALARLPLPKRVYLYSRESLASHVDLDVDPVDGSEHGCEGAALRHVQILAGNRVPSGEAGRSFRIPRAALATQQTTRTTRGTGQTLFAVAVAAVGVVVAVRGALLIFAALLFAGGLVLAGRSPLFS